MKELTSQLMGRIKSRLSRFGAQLRVQLPTVASSRSRFAASGEHRHYAFRSLKGDISVTLVGDFSDDFLDYAHATGSRSDPDVLRFF